MLQANPSQTQLVNPGDIFVLSNAFQIYVFLRNGLNAGSFQACNPQDNCAKDFYANYVGNERRFIAAKTGDFSPLENSAAHRNKHSILCFPLVNETIDVDGPVVALHQWRLLWETQGGNICLVDGKRNDNRQKLVVESRPELLEQLDRSASASYHAYYKTNVPLHVLDVEAARAQRRAFEDLQTNIVPIVDGLKASIIEVAGRREAGLIFGNTTKQYKGWLDKFINDQTEELVKLFVRDERTSPLMPRVVRHQTTAQVAEARF